MMGLKTRELGISIIKEQKGKLTVTVYLFEEE
jgi:hypothetical protein